MNRLFLLGLVAFGLCAAAPIAEARTQRACPRPIADGVEDFVWPYGASLDPPCIVTVTARGPDKLYRISPAPPGLKERAIERDDKNGTAGVSYVSANGETAIAIGVARRYPLPHPVYVADGSQVSTADFLPRPGIVLNLTNERVAQWHEEGGLYTLTVARSYTGASLEEIAAHLRILELEPPRTGSGSTSDSSQTALAGALVAASLFLWLAMKGRRANRFG